MLQIFRFLNLFTMTNFPYGLFIDNTHLVFQFPTDAAHSLLNPFIPDSAKSKIDKLFNNCKVGKIEKTNSTTIKYSGLLNSFPMDGHT